MVATSLVGVVSMRLVRTLCPKCKESYAGDSAAIARLSASAPADDEPIELCVAPAARPVKAPASRADGHLRTARSVRQGPPPHHEQSAPTARSAASRSRRQTPSQDVSTKAFTGPHDGGRDHARRVPRRAEREGVPHCTHVVSQDFSTARRAAASASTASAASACARNGRLPGVRRRAPRTPTAGAEVRLEAPAGATERPGVLIPRTRHRAPGSRARRFSWRAGRLRRLRPLASAHLTDAGGSIPRLRSTWSRAPRWSRSSRTAPTACSSPPASPRSTTCARRLRTPRDGHDYVPTKRWVLFGHHFAAISGAGPLLGPVLAAQFGWAPGFLWLLLGSVIAGGVMTSSCSPRACVADVRCEHRARAGEPAHRRGDEHRDRVRDGGRARRHGRSSCEFAARHAWACSRSAARSRSRSSWDSSPTASARAP